MTLRVAFKFYPTRGASIIICLSLSPTTMSRRSAIACDPRREWGFFFHGETRYCATFLISLTCLLLYFVDFIHLLFTTPSHPAAVGWLIQTKTLGRRSWFLLFLSQGHPATAGWLPIQSVGAVGFFFTIIYPKVTQQRVGGCQSKVLGRRGSILLHISQVTQQRRGDHLPKRWAGGDFLPLLHAQLILAMYHCT